MLRIVLVVKADSAACRDVIVRVIAEPVDRLVGVMVVAIFSVHVFAVVKDHAVGVEALLGALKPDVVKEPFEEAFHAWPSPQ